jgi:pimeloyl-ACP methyl ester carboxylesterase
VTLEQRIAKFPPRLSKNVSYRENGAGRALVLLHGIGSASGSWLHQLQGLEGFRVLAWDAPGYEQSQILKKDQPIPADYAESLAGFIERLLLKDVVLVANSLGALMAGAYAREHPERVRAMLLISPAGGYAKAGAAEREEKLAFRLQQLEELGPSGLAEKRSPNLLGSKAQPDALALVQWSQRRIDPVGYRQAAYCLANGDLAGDARHFRKRVLVVCGTEDKITPEAGCRMIAAAFPNAAYRPLAGLGHVSHIEDPKQLNRLIAEFAQ